MDPESLEPYKTLTPKNPTLSLATPTRHRKAISPSEPKTRGLLVSDTRMDRVKSLPGLCAWEDQEQGPINPSPFPLNSIRCWAALDVFDAHEGDLKPQMT